MAFYRVVFKFQEFGYGWSEAWYTRGDVSPSTLGTLVQTYVNLRLGMLRPYCNFESVRLAVVPDDVIIGKAARSSRLLVAGNNKYPTEAETLKLGEFGTYAGVESDAGMEQVRSNLQLRLFWGTNSTTRYLVGIPDGLSITETGSCEFDRVPVWGAKYIAWAAFVKDKLAIAAHTPEATDHTYEVRAVSDSTESPSHLEFQVPDTPTQGWTVGDKIQVSGFRYKRSVLHPSMNGRYKLHTIALGTPRSGVNTYTMREIVGIPAADIKVLGTIRRIQRRRTAIEGIDPFRVGIHKRGKSSSVPRGRRLTRVSLDP